MTSAALTPTLLRAGRATATAAGVLKLRGRRMHVAAVVAVFGDDDGRDGHEAALVQAIVEALAAAPGGATGRMRAAIAAADAALRTRAAGRPIGGPSLTAAVSLLAADGDEAVLAEAGATLAFASTVDGLPMAVRPATSSYAGAAPATTDADPNRPPLGRPGNVEPLIRWARWEPSAFPRGLRVLAASRDGAEGLSAGVVGALFGTPLDRWSNALTTALPASAAAIVLAFPPAAPAPRRHEPAGPRAEDEAPPRMDTVHLGYRPPSEPGAPGLANAPGSANVPGATNAPGSTYAPGSQIAPYASPGGVPSAVPSAGPSAGPTIRRVTTSRPTSFGDALERAVDAARRSAATVPWRAIGAKAARGAARLFLALFPRRFATRDRAAWSQLLATAAVLLPLVILAATIAILARQPGGLGAGLDRLGRSGDAPNTGQDGAPNGAGTPEAAPLSAAGSTGATDSNDATAGASPAPAATVPVATLASFDAALEAGMVRLTDAAGVARVQGADGDGRRVVAVGDTVYVLNPSAGVVEASTAAAVLPVLQSGGTVAGQPVGDLIDLAWLPLADGAGQTGGATGQVAALDAQGQLWALEGVAARPLAVAGGLAHGTRAIGGYDGGLYGLDTANGVTRYAPAPGPSFSAGEAWLTPAADLSTALDIAIDGSVFVLLPGGVIRRFAAGEAAPFSAATVPGGLAGASALYASPTAGRLLVADAAAGRFVALALDGVYEAQLALPILPAAAPDSDDARGRIRALQGVFWDEGASRLWWLSGAELYRAGYPR